MTRDVRDEAAACMVKRRANWHAGTGREPNRPARHARDMCAQCYVPVHRVSPARGCVRSVLHSQQPLTTRPDAHSETADSSRSRLQRTCRAGHGVDGRSVAVWCRQLLRFMCRPCCTSKFDPRLHPMPPIVLRGGRAQPRAPRIVMARLLVAAALSAGGLEGCTALQTPCGILDDLSRGATRCDSQRPVSSQRCSHGASQTVRAAKLDVGNVAGGLHSVQGSHGPADRPADNTAGSRRAFARFRAAAEDCVEDDICTCMGRHGQAVHIPVLLQRSLVRWRGCTRVVLMLPLRGVVHSCDA